MVVVLLYDYTMLMMVAYFILWELGYSNFTDFSSVQFTFLPGILYAYGRPTLVLVSYVLTTSLLRYRENGELKILTKGDNNQVDDRGLYAPGQFWLNKSDIIGRARGWVLIISLLLCPLGLIGCH